MSLSLHQFIHLSIYPKRRPFFLTLLSLLGAVLIGFTIALPSQAHWADMSAAEIVVEPSAVQITLTYPTGLTPFADDNQNGQLSVDEVQTHASRLAAFLGQSIRLTDAAQQPATLTLEPFEQGIKPTAVQAAPNTHSTVKLTYAWQQPVAGIKIHYNLFLPGVPTANCLATILQNHQLKTFVFTPKQQVLALTPGLAPPMAGGWLAIVGAMVWGAMHSLSPGHGKTLVGAYLVGTRATPRHAIFLAMTTTITHTLGIFALGLLTLFASRYIVPEQLYPWMNLLSGLMVVGIGLHLFWNRLRGRSAHHHVHSSDHHEPDRHSHHEPDRHSHHEHHHHEPDRHEPDRHGPDHCTHGHDVHHHEHHHAHSHNAHSHHEHLHNHDEYAHRLYLHNDSKHDYQKLDHQKHDSHFEQNYHLDSHHHQRSHSNYNYADPNSLALQPLATHHTKNYSHGHSTQSIHLTHPPSNFDIQRNSHPHYPNHPADQHPHPFTPTPPHPHTHSHLPPITDGAPVTWRSLLALGISGGLVPCPAALVLLLSCIALGDVGLGLVLVLAFSLGLAGVLIALGLLMVYAKRLFRRLPTPKRASRLLPAFSGLGIALIGFGLSTQAILQIVKW